MCPISNKSWDIIFQKLLEKYNLKKDKLAEFFLQDRMATCVPVTSCNEQRGFMISG